jgi:3-oxoacyl-[acyl-carrier-protein] synthase-3
MGAQTSERVFVHGCRYAVGEQDAAVADISGLAEFLESQQMIPEPALWGWDRYRVSTVPAAQLARTAASASLAAAGEATAHVDAVIVCAARFSSDIESHAQFVGRLLEDTDLRHAVPYGVSHNRCATMTSALGLAAALVRAGQHRAVLVVAADRLGERGSRLAPFAVFSDGAAACVVARDVPGPLELLATAAAVDAAEMRPNGELSAALARRVSDELAARTGTTTTAVRRLAHHNVFAPIVRLKEQQAGFRANQLYLRNIARLAHVYSCDPFINLADMVDEGLLGAGDLVALGSGVSGARFGALLRVS